MQSFERAEYAENPTRRRFTPSKKGAGFAQFLFGNRWNLIMMIVCIRIVCNDTHDISQGIVQNVSWNTTSNRTRNGEKFLFLDWLYHSFTR